MTGGETRVRRVRALTRATLLVPLLALASCGGQSPSAGADGKTATLRALGLDGGELVPLSKVPVPRPPRTDIVDQAAAVRLGKALFWDMQLGSDGQTACASCHFQAGADSRMTNTVNPGPNQRWEALSGPGQTFSFRLKEDGTDGEDHADPGGDDILGSQGVVRMVFKAIAKDRNVAADVCEPDLSSPFGTYRQVTGRNAPATIAAVFNRQQFWDGRANDKFNGFNPFGDTRNATLPTTKGKDKDKDKDRNLVALSSKKSGPEDFDEDGDISNIDQGKVEDLVPNSSLASQAVGPVNNDVEMACAGRKMNGHNGVAAKMLERRPLRLQQVSPQDSVLGSLADPKGGLKVSYKEMIKAAFKDKEGLRSHDRFTNILGQAIQAYESTLIPDQTPFDRFLAGQKSALTDRQQEGFQIFQGRGGCMNCHSGTELTDASPRFFAKGGPRNVDGGDQGFHNIGVRPTGDDLGRANLGPGGASFSESGSSFDRGAFKTPSLRNVALTAPYFHNGSKATLHDVIDFYERHGDFDNPEKSKLMDRIELRSEDHPALEDFLLRGLLDCRVARSAAPFDHPSLPIPNGPSLPAVGAGGQGSCP